MKCLNPALQVSRSISNPLTVGAIRGSKWHNASKWFDVEPGMYTSRNRMSEYSTNTDSMVPPFLLLFSPTYVETQKTKPE